MTVKCPVLSRNQAEQLDEWIRTLLWEGKTSDVPEHQVEVLRCKGIYTTEDGQQHLLQGVREMYEITDLPTEGDEPSKEGKLVFIGRGLTDDVKHSLVKLLHV
jgi:G3E family GTPase